MRYPVTIGPPVDLARAQVPGMGPCAIQPRPIRESWLVLDAPIDPARPDAPVTWSTVAAGSDGNLIRLFPYLAPPDPGGMAAYFLALGAHLAEAVALLRGTRPLGLHVCYGSGYEPADLAGTPMLRLWLGYALRVA